MDSSAQVVESFLPPRLLDLLTIFSVWIDLEEVSMKMMMTKLVAVSRFPAVEEAVGLVLVRDDWASAGLAILALEIFVMVSCFCFRK